MQDRQEVSSVPEEHFLQLPLLKWDTAKILEIGKPEIIVANILKIEQFGLTLQ